MDAEALYRTLSHLVETMPSFKAFPLTKEEFRWLGRASAAIEQVGDTVDKISFNLAVGRIGPTSLRDPAVREVGMLLHRALARAEIHAPAAIQGSFIPVGHQFDALVAVGRVLGQAQRSLLIVDPYMDIATLSEFCPLVPDAVAIRLLTDPSGMRSTLAPAAAAWVAQHGSTRPLEVRVTSPKALHDRLIIVDGAEAWILTQSLKDFAARSPGSITRADASSASLKADYYLDLWGTADPL